jgi:glyoxylase-like metal-dependent hydrolase (beta-lactamase superfamily II)
VLAVPGRYSVTYLVVGPERVAAVDVGSAVDVEPVLAALAWLGRRVASLAFVTPSHLHFDHAMGVDALARRTGAEVRLGRIALEASRGARRLRWPPGLPLIRMIPTWPMQGMPVLPLCDWREGLDFGVPWGKNRFRARLGSPLLEGAPLEGFPDWEILETPGHADDAIALYHRAAGFLIAGDTVRNFLGGEWNPLRCDQAAFARTKARLLALEVRAVFPAHGPALEGERVLERLNALPWWCP